MFRLINYKKFVRGCLFVIDTITVKQEILAQTYFSALGAGYLLAQTYFSAFPVFKLYFSSTLPSRYIHL